MRFTAILFITACAGSTNYWNAYTPATGHTEKPIDRAKLAIIDAGKEIETSDDSLVVSRWFSGDGFGGDQNRFRIRVSLAGGSYDIAAQCQGKDSMSGAWADNCDGEKRPQFVLDLLSKVEGALR